MRIRVTTICEYDVEDDPVKRREAYNGAETDEEIIAMEQEIIDDDPGYLLALGEDWKVDVERVD